MEFMGFHIVDIVIVSLVLFLAIKGLVNGFSKELFNFITIVGGVIAAARYNLVAVDFINQQNIVPAIPENYAKIIGFIGILLAIWLVMGLISSVVTKLTSRQPSFISRLLGYILSAARYLFIFSLIIFGINKSEFFKNEAETLKSKTKLFVPMAKAGATILNMDSNVTVTKERKKEETTTSILNKMSVTTPNDLNGTVENTFTEENISY